MVLGAGKESGTAGQQRQQRRADVPVHGQRRLSGAQHLLWDRAQHVSSAQCLYMNFTGRWSGRLWVKKEKTEYDSSKRRDFSPKDEEDDLKLHN